MLGDGHCITDCWKSSSRLPPWVELASSVTDFNIGATARYLPAGIMAPGVFRYLDRAIIAGRVSSADVAGFGPVEAFPFDNGELAGTTASAEPAELADPPSDAQPTRARVEIRARMPAVFIAHLP